MEKPCSTQVQAAHLIAHTLGFSAIFWTKQREQAKSTPLQ